MNRKAPASRVALLLLATLAMRAAIPDGYMPSRVGSGLLFELCPSGVPAGFLDALAGRSMSHHHGHESSDEGHFNASQCPIGHFLSFAMVVGDFQLPDSPELAAEPVIRRLVPEPISVHRRAHRSRGPPTA